MPWFAGFDHWRIVLSSLATAGNFHDTDMIAFQIVNSPEFNYEADESFKSGVAIFGPRWLGVV